MTTVHQAQPHSVPSEEVERKQAVQSAAKFHELQSSCGKIVSLEHLLEVLREIFSEDRVDTDLVRAVMTSYKSDPGDWIKFAKWDPNRYTRNLVDDGNGKYNIMILCWNEGQGSAIHDHAGSHCFMKAIQGTFLETQFYWPDTAGCDVPQEGTADKDDDLASCQPMQEKRRTVLEENEVAYIHDTIGLHRVENYSHVDKGATLHLYCPPYEECDAFDERTGKRRQCQVTFYTRFGQRTFEQPQECAPENN